MLLPAIGQLVEGEEWEEWSASLQALRWRPEDMAAFLAASAAWTANRPLLRTQLAGAAHSAAPHTRGAPHSAEPPPAQDVAPAVYSNDDGDGGAAADAAAAAVGPATNGAVAVTH